MGCAGILVPFDMLYPWPLPSSLPGCSLCVSLYTGFLSLSLVCSCVHMYVWSSKVHPGCLPPRFQPSFWRQDLPRTPEFINSVRPEQWQTPRLHLSPFPQGWNRCKLPCLALLCSKLFTDQTIPQLQFPLFIQTPVTVGWDYLLTYFN